MPRMRPAVIDESYNSHGLAASCLGQAVSGSKSKNTVYFYSESCGNIYVVLAAGRVTPCTR